MALIWSKQFESGSSKINAHHKTLFKLINELGQFLNRKKFNPADAQIHLIEFEQFVTAHFKFEEICMARQHCPVSYESKLEHNNFLHTFEEFKRHYNSSADKKALLQKLHTHSEEWFKSHIGKVDVKVNKCEMDALYEPR